MTLAQLLGGDEEAKGEWLRDLQIGVAEGANEQFAKSPWQDFRRAELQLSLRQQNSQHFGDGVFLLSDRQWQSHTAYRDWQLWAGHRVGSPGFSHYNKVGASWQQFVQETNSQIFWNTSVNHYWQSGPESFDLDGQLKFTRHLTPDINVLANLSLSNSWQYPAEWRSATSLLVNIETGIAWQQWQFIFQRQENAAYEDYWLHYNWQAKWQNHWLTAFAQYGPKHNAGLQAQWVMAKDVIAFVEFEWQNDQWEWTNEALTLAAGWRLLSR